MTKSSCLLTVRLALDCCLSTLSDDHQSYSFAENDEKTKQQQQRNTKKSIGANSISLFHCQ